MIKKKILVGMSGGVDSSVAAALLVEQGYEVRGVFVEAYNEPGCRTDEDKKDALQVALALGIPFEVLDLRKEYKERVVSYFLDEYKNGKTPNPDIICNRDIKFGLLYEHMERGGYDYLATGHYARVAVVVKNQDSVKNYYLQRPLDLSKDQTYFLWQVDQAKLEKVLWPLGELEKSKVREKARELALTNADKPDSMGVCMIGELNVREFLKNKIGVLPGEVVWNDRVVGTHEGIWFYTIGARGGWEIDSRYQGSSMSPLYVVSKDVARNQLVVGERELLNLSKFKIENCQGDLSVSEMFVRIRNLGELVPVVEFKNGVITLEKPIFAPAPGQSAVFYDSAGIVRGGGIIANRENSVYLK